ncbi:hypothetical protein Tco_1468512 [Tanacetum coccineum]
MIHDSSDQLVMSVLTVVVTFPGDKLLMLLEQRENTLLEQVEATQGNNGLSSVTTVKGRVIFPSSVLCPREKGMKRGSMIKPMILEMPMTLIVMNLTQPRLLSWRIFPRMAQMHSLRPKSKNAKVRVNTEESAVKPEPELKNTIECNLNPSDGPGKPNSISMKTVKTKWALNQLQQPICVQLTKTVKTLKAQS